MKIRALIFGLLFTVVAAQHAGADPARLINYQGRLTDSNGVPLANGSYDMTFKIYDALTLGTLLWTEAHTGAAQVTVTNGLFSVVLGSSTALLDFNSTPYYIEITVGATVYSPRKQLTGSAFSVNADLLDGQHASYYQRRVSGTCGAGSSIRIINADGTVTCQTDVGVTAHGSLTGLGNDDHPQYFALAQDEAVTGRPAFNGGTTGSNSPFDVDSTYVVANLNADLIDGYHASSFILDGCADCLNATEIEDIFVLNTSDTMSGSLGVGTTLSVGTSATVGTTLGVTGAITGSSTIQGTQLISTIVTGTAPFTVSSTTGVTNLNADLLDGYHAADLEAVLDHGQLQGLGDDDHTQYFALAQSETVTGIPAFNGGTSGSTAPFTADSTFLVTNLNADLLDGYHASSFIFDGCADCLNATEIEDIYVFNTGDSMSGALSISMASGPALSVTNNSASANVANFTGGPDDTAYEWVGFYSGASRLGIFLWDGAWNECLANEFCITGDAGPLALDSNGTIYMRDPVDHENQGIIDIDWSTSDDGSGSGLDADLLDGYDWSNVPNGTDIWVNEAGDTMSGNLDMGGSYVVTNAARFDTTGVSSYDKLRVWNSGSYAIGMTSGNTYGGVINEYAMTFTMDTTANRGFIWRDSADAVNDAAMSLSTGGILTVKSNITNYGNLSSSGISYIGPIYVNQNATRDTVNYSTITSTPNLHLDSKEGNAIYLDWYGGGGGVRIGNGAGDDTGALYAGILYDGDNTARYVDPSSNSYFNRIVSVDNTTMVTNLNADLLDGYGASTTRNAANTIPIRDGSGYLQLGWINTTSGDNGTTAIAHVYASQDDYIRYYTPDNFRIAMGGALSCTIVSFSAAAGSTNCPSGKSVVGAMDTSRTLINPASFAGAAADGYMICCPTTTTFP